MNEPTGNETIKHIMERYSCRDFADTPLTDKQIKILTDAALASPSALNHQPWHVIVVTDKALLTELDTEAMAILAEAADKSGYERMLARGGRIFYNAPCMFLIASDASKYAVVDCGILSENICIAAQSLGLGNLIYAMAAIPLNSSRGEEFKKRLKIPEGYGFGMAILVGTARSTKAPHELDETKVTYVN